MAFSNLQSTTLGNLKVTYGEWTHTQAAASETIDLAGGRCWLAVVASRDTTGALDFNLVRISESVAGNVNTVTLYPKEGVTTGRAFFVHS